jgi:hypothetical protein
MSASPPTEKTPALEAYRATVRMRMAFVDWHRLACELAYQGRLATQEQIDFSELTNKLVVLARGQTPPIDPGTLIDLVRLDPIDQPHVASRYAKLDGATATFELIRASWWRSQPTAETGSPGGTTETKVESKPPGDPASRAVAAALALRKQGKLVSVRAACLVAKVDRKNLTARHPETIEFIEQLAEPDRKPSSGKHDRRTGFLDALDDSEDD